MRFVQRDTHQPIVANFSKAEVDGLIGNLISLNLPQGDPYLKILEGRTFIELDKLFNGAPN